MTEQPTNQQAIVQRKLQEGAANLIAQFQLKGEQAMIAVVDGVFGVLVHYNGLSTTEFIPLEPHPRKPKAGQGGSRR